MELEWKKDTYHRNLLLIANNPRDIWYLHVTHQSNPGQPHKFAIYFYDWDFVIFLWPFNFNLLVLFCSWVKKIPFALLWYSPNDWCLELWEVVNQTHKVDGRNLWKLPCEILSCCHTLLPLKEKKNQNYYWLLTVLVCKNKNLLILTHSFQMRANRFLKKFGHLWTLCCSVFLRASPLLSRVSHKYISQCSALEIF